MDPLALMILLGGLAWLLMRYSDPDSRRCKDCGMPGSTLSDGGHWPDCPQVRGKQ